MRKFTLLVAVLMMVAFAGTGCKKKQPPPPPMPPQGSARSARHARRSARRDGGAAGREEDRRPRRREGGWKAVKVEVEFKEKKSKKAFTIPLNSEFKVPDSDLTLKVGASCRTSRWRRTRSRPARTIRKNPAAQIEAFQGGKEIFHGWLFAKFPAVHPLTHDKYGVALLEGVKK